MRLSSTDNLSIGARLIRGSFFRTLSATVAMVIGFFMMPFLVKHLGPHWYGIWATVGSLVGNYYLLDLGLSTAVTRYVTETLAKNDTDRANSMISTAFFIYCGLALVLLVVTLIMSAMVGVILPVNADTQVVQFLVFISGLTLAVGFPFKALTGIIQSKLRYDLLSSSQLIILIVATGLTVYLIGYNDGMNGTLVLASVGFFASIASDVVFFIISKYLFPKLNITWRLFDRRIVRELFSFSIWAFLINASNQIRLRIDILVVAGVQSTIAATHYSVGSRIAEIAIEFLYQATNMIQPLVTRYHATSDHEGMRLALIFLSKINVALGAFVSGMLLILGEPFIARWMGEDFVSSSLVLYLLAAALTMGFIVNPLDYTLIAILRHRFLGIVNLVDALINLGLSIWLGLSLGLVGVALGTLIPMIITRFLLIAPYTCRQTGLSVTTYAGRIIWTIILASLVLVPTAFFVQPFLPGSGYGTFTIIIFSTGLIYAPVIFFGTFSSSERIKLLTSLSAAVSNKKLSHWSIKKVG